MAKETSTPTTMTPPKNGNADKPSWVSMLDQTINEANSNDNDELVGKFFLSFTIVYFY
jgi:hypothetical protein